MIIIFLTVGNPEATRLQRPKCLTGNYIYRFWKGERWNRSRRNLNSELKVRQNVTKCFALPANGSYFFITQKVLNIESSNRIFILLMWHLGGIVIGWCLFRDAKLLPWSCFCVIKLLQVCFTKHFQKSDKTIKTA